MIKELDISKAEYVSLKRDISNWNKTAEIIYNTDDQDLVYKLLLVENKAFNRDYNRKRLYQRFSRLRRIKEKRDLKKFLTDVEYTDADTNIIKNQFKLNFHLLKHPMTSEQLLRILKAEITNFDRPYMRNKIYGHFQTQRQQEEKKGLKL